MEHFLERNYRLDKNKVHLILGVNKHSGAPLNSCWRRTRLLCGMLVDKISKEVFEELG